MKYIAPEINIIMFEAVDQIVASTVSENTENTDNGVIPGGSED